MYISNHFYPSVLQFNRLLIIPPLITTARSAYCFSYDVSQSVCIQFMNMCLPIVTFYQMNSCNLLLNALKLGLANV